MKEIWKRIFVWVRLGNKNKQEEKPICSCGRHHNIRPKPISVYLDQVMDERSKEAEMPKSNEDSSVRNFPGCDKEGYSLDKR